MKRLDSTRYSPLHVWRLLCLFVLLSWGGMAYAQVVGVVTHLSGVLTAKRADGSTAVLAIQSKIQQGDTLITESNTYTRVKFLDNGEIVLRPGSQLVVKSYLYDADKPEKDNVSISLVKGGLRAVTGLVGKRNHDAVSFDTPTATIGIRGTHFGALFCQNDCGSVPTANGSTPQNGLHVDVAQGAIVLTNPAGQQVFQTGQFGYVANLNTPPTVVPPTQGVPVTMPQSISKNAPGTQQSAKSGNVDCIVQ
ncbi:FecR family protein [Herbaspirillum rhizosphaerae]|uniref:FecR family protein n=1 Tax=Herbaspirillum rhizosphaerae TaxID=346179 RepID=UPI00067D4C0C|nr:FecR domain-containing protein [Herbaspirillum rhizosphaerae]